MMNRLTLFVLPLAMAWLCGPFAAAGSQDSPPPDEPAATGAAVPDDHGATSAPAGESPGTGDERPRRMRRWAAEGAAERGVLSMLRGWPMQPGPEDEGPLRDGEEADLLDFTRQTLPALHAVLAEEQARDGAQFSQRFAHMAPRLRFLRRISAAHPDAGRVLIAHAQQQFRIERARRMLTRAFAARMPPSFNRDRVEEELRTALVESVATEARVLRMQADALERERERLIEERLLAALDPAADPATHPAPVRTLISEIHAAQESPTDASAQHAAELTARLRDMVAQRIDRDITSRRERSADQEARSAEIVDERFAAVLAGAEADGNRMREERGRGPGRPPGGADRPAGSSDRPPGAPERPRRGK
ncbi:MAG: hypothetical protein IPM64_02065 [Phycisphaerales bacterium]|nr:hypothetical protein [Phycisphaerales bacterium]